MSGDVFIFVNRQRNRIKLLRWEAGGFVLFYKRLEKGIHAGTDILHFSKIGLRSTGKQILQLIGGAILNHIQGVF